MTCLTTRRGRSLWASSPKVRIAADPSIAGCVIVIPDPDFVPPPDAANRERALSAFVPASVLREMLETLEGEPCEP